MIGKPSSSDRSGRRAERWAWFWMSVFLGASLLLLLGACQPRPEAGGSGQPAERAEGHTEQPAAKPKSDRQLVISYRSSEQRPWQRQELDCLRSQEPSCQLLRKLPAVVWSPPAANQQCAMIYGGPQQARVAGILDGQKIDSRFSRQDGCQISRWQQLAPILAKLDLFADNDLS